MSDKRNDDIDKVVRVGTGRTSGGRGFSVYCWIKYDARLRKLSITGVEGPLPSGNCLGSCGQIVDALLPVNLKALAPGWSRDDVKKLREIWEEHHLNHMVAGSPRQEAFLRANPPPIHATWVEGYRKPLEEAGLNPDTEYLHDGKPYHYGSAWLKRDVPGDVLAWLYTRPNADKEPAWI